MQLAWRLLFGLLLLLGLDLVLVLGLGSQDL
jgi:hypothetical protein